MKKTLISPILAGLLALTTALLGAVLPSPRAKSAGGPVAVQIANSATSPVPNSDVDNPAHQPIQFLAQPDTSGTNSNRAETDIPVPAHKRFVIEYVSAGLAEGTGRVVMETRAGGNLIAYYFLDDNSNRQFFPTRIYADPGSDVQVIVHSSNGQPIQADVEISGYYVNVP